jgi:hypothetical protein
MDFRHSRCIKKMGKKTSVINLTYIVTTNPDIQAKHQHL